MVLKNMGSFVVASDLKLKNKCSGLGLCVLCPNTLAKHIKLSPVENVSPLHVKIAIITIYAKYGQETRPIRAEQIQV